MPMEQIIDQQEKKAISKYNINICY